MPEIGTSVVVDDMLYTTGDAQWRRLYYVEFDGVTPQAPILLSGDSGAEQVAFGFMSEDRCWYIAGDAPKGPQAFMIVDFGDGPPEAVQVSEPLDAGYKLLNYTFSAGQTKIAYAVAGMQQSWLSLVDRSVEPSTPQQKIYVAPFADYIVGAMPTFGQLMPFMARTGPDDRRIVAVDLSDPELPVTQLTVGIEVQPMCNWYRRIAGRCAPRLHSVHRRTTSTTVVDAPWAPGERVDPARACEGGYSRRGRVGSEMHVVRRVCDSTETIAARRAAIARVDRDDCRT